MGYDEDNAVNHGQNSDGIKQMENLMLVQLHNNQMINQSQTVHKTEDGMLGYNLNLLKTPHASWMCIHGN